MTRNQRTLHAFDARSLLLFASLTLGSATALMAQPAPGAVLGPSGATTPAGSASSDSDAQDAQNSFQRADLNADGFLSREEAQTLPAVLEKFDLWDRDADGKLSLGEFINGARTHNDQ